MTVGKIAEFNIHKDDWKLYIDRLQQYFVVNEIKAAMQVPTLITVMGSESYELLVNLCTPTKPSTKTFESIVEVMEKHLQPKPSELAERYKFRQRLQKGGETISEYIAVLKKMSKTCEFGTWLEESLRDQLVCGINSETIRQRLFAETGLTYSMAYTLAISLETAEKDAAIVVEGQGKSSGDAATAECQAMTVSTWRKNGTKEGTRRGSSKAAAASAARGNGSVREIGPRVWERDRARASASSVGPELGERARRLRSSQCCACGGAHDSTTCKFTRYVCRVCNRRGHLQRMCANLTEQYYVEANSVDVEGNITDSSEEVINIDFNQLSVSQCKPIIITLKVQKKTIDMECDTGSAVSCISKEMYKKKFNDLKIISCQLALRYYTGETVRPIGMIRPSVEYNGQKKVLDLYVIENGKTALLGRQWIAELNVQLPSFQYNNLFSLKDEEFNLNTFSSRYCNVFAEGLGRFTGPPVSIHVRPGARPVYMRARPLAYALRGPVERVLDQHVRDGILTPVERSDWATPIVPVVKKDGNIRICADYKVTLNKVLEIDRYPLPRVEDLLVRLHGGERFSKIDLSQAYAQLVLDETKKYTVINTHKGLFMYNRLVYGLSSSPGIFQRRLEELFCDLPCVGVFLDDVIITGKTTQEHIQNLHKVFGRLEKSGLRLKKEKCEFFSESLTYLGHVISKEGVHTCQNKIKTIVETPAPTNVSELRSFIGMVMYYSKFVKNVSTILAPLYNLLKTGSRFEWNSACQRAFEQMKGRLTSSEVLIHYSPELPLVLTADASSVGVGAVLSHVTAAGERPVAYASRALTAAERHYSQIDREALAIIFGIRKYHQYLYGRKFILRTDHKPLTHIFGNKVGIPVMAASRLQRWAVQLTGYNYDIEYVASKKNCADALSRLPATYNSKRDAVKEVTYLNFVENYLPLKNEDVRKATAKDKELSRIKMYVESGWPIKCIDEEIKPFYDRRHELYIEGGCVMWGYRLIIPTGLRSIVLKQLHSSHMGIVKTKCWARSYVWWPRIDSDVEALCRACDTCALEAPAPPRAAPAPWPYCPQPWSRIHVDFLGPFREKTFLVLVDSTSKWLEAFEMKSTNASNVVKVLRATFARFGLPAELVSDQGPPFTSSEFSSFLRNNGIRQVFSPAYHPASNGAAENAVKLCKRALKKAYRDKVDIDAALQTFLLTYRNTVHSTTGETPSMLLQRRSLRTRLDLLRNDRVVQDRVRNAQDSQARLAGGVQRDFVEGDYVWAKGYGSQDKWVRSTVITKEGSRRYVVDSGNGQILKRHVDQMRRRSRLSDVTCPKITSDISPQVNEGESAVSQVPADAVVDGSITSGKHQIDPIPANQQVGKSSDVPLQSELSQNIAKDNTGASHASPQLPSQNESRFVRQRKPVVRFGFEID